MRRTCIAVLALIAGLATAAQCPSAGTVLNTVTGSPSTQTSDGNSVVMPKQMCTALSVAFFNALPVVCQSAQSMDNTQNLVAFTDTVGTDKDGKPDAKDIAPLTAYMGSPPQMHEKDGDLIVLAFVSARAPAHITVDNGIIKDQAGNLHGHDWVCGSIGYVQFGEDPDCITGYPTANGVIVFEVVPDPAGHRGASTITLTQGPPSTMMSIPFTVVGEAASVTVTSLKPAVQAGLGGGTNNAAAGTLRPPAPGGDPTQQCLFPTGGATGLVEANLTLQRAIGLTRVFDSDGTPIIGAFVLWQSDDPEVATAALPLVPTLDTGTLGYAAPNILCGTANGGTITLTVTTTPYEHPPRSGYPVDAAAPIISASTQLTVLSLPVHLPLP